MNQTQPELVTTTLLLQRLHNSSDDDAWRHFDDRFRRVIISTGLRLGLNGADAEEAAQETMFQAIRDYQANRYDRSKGRLSSWIIGIARHRIIDILRRHREGTLPDGADEPALVDPSEHLVEQVFEQSLERQIFSDAWEMIRATGRSSVQSLQAFELTALRGVPAQEAARQCGMSVDQVYIARNRVAQRLREMVQRIDEAVRDGL